MRTKQFPRLDFRSHEPKSGGVEDALWIGIDVGGTKVAAILVDAMGTVCAFTEVPTNKATPKGFIEQISAVIRQLVGDRGVKQVAAIGVGLPGQVNPVEGTTFSPFNLGWSERVKIKEPLEHIFNIPVYVDNDLNTAILAEWRQGSGKGQDNFCYATIGTGIAVGLVLGGKLYTGSHFLAGELGHITVDPTARPCSCGSRGCLEELVSGPGIVRSYNEAVRNKQNAPFTRAEQVFSLAREGDAQAMQVVQDTAKYLAIGLNNLAALYDPDVIAIGGGISEAGDIFFNQLDLQLKTWLSGVVDTSLRIIPATFRSHTGVIGACHMANQRVLRDQIKNLVG
jgi:glucokinase